MPFPAQSAFPKLAVIGHGRGSDREERKDQLSSDVTTSPRACSRPRLSPRPCAATGASRTRVHWVLDVTFKEDLSRLRVGHGADNMAVVRHFALNLVRQAKDKRAIKRRRKIASWNPDLSHRNPTAQPPLTRTRCPARAPLWTTAPEAFAPLNRSAPPRKSAGLLYWAVGVKVRPRRSRQWMVS